MVADSTPLAVVVDLHTTFILTASTLVDRVSQSHKDILGWKEGGREGEGRKGFMSCLLVFWCGTRDKRTP